MPGSDFARCQLNAALIPSYIPQGSSSTVPSTSLIVATSILTISAAAAISQVSTSSAPTMTQAPTIAGSTSTDAATVQEQNTNGGISGGAIAGIVIGVVVGLALVGALIWWLLRRTRSKGSASTPTHFADEKSRTQIQYAELDSGEQRHELASQDVTTPQTRHKLA